MTQKQFYKSTAWKKARSAFIQSRISKDGGLCQDCGHELGYIVHHKVWLDDINCNDPAISLNADLFRYVCLECHNKIKDPNRIPGRARFDEFGNVYESGTSPHARTNPPPRRDRQRGGQKYSERITKEV